MGFLYTMVDKESETSYPSYANVGGGPGEIHPNVTTFIGAVNKSQPIVKAQYEMVFSRWPRTIFFAKDVTIPGISVNTIDINHAGFTIPIATHSYYETNEITINVLADKEGYHYYDWRNFVLQAGHPLVAGDPASTMGNNYNLNAKAVDYLDIKLRNTPDERIYHHWVINNFRPIGIGNLELSHEDESLLEFEVTGTFTHIDYDCGLGFRDFPIPTNIPEQDEKNPEPKKHFNTVEIPSTDSTDSSNGNDSTGGDGGGGGGGGDGTDSTGGGGGGSGGGGGDGSDSPGGGAGSDGSGAGDSTTGPGGDSTSHGPDSTEQQDSSLSSSSYSSTLSSEASSSSEEPDKPEPPGPSNVDEITLRNIDTSLQWSGNLPIDATVVNMLRLKNPQGTPLTTREVELARNCQERLENAGRDFLAEISRIRDTVQPDPNWRLVFVTKVLGSTTMTPRESSDGNNDLVRNQIVVRVGIKSQQQQQAFERAVNNYIQASEAIKNQYRDQVGNASREIRTLKMSRAMPHFEIFDLQTENIQQIEELEEPDSRVVDNIPRKYLDRTRFTEYKWKGQVVKSPRRAKKVLSSELESLTSTHWRFNERQQVGFVYGYPVKVNVTNSKVSFSPTVGVYLMKSDGKRSPREQALAKAYLKKVNYEIMKLMNCVQNLSEIPADSGYSPKDVQIPIVMSMAVPTQSQRWPVTDKICAGGKIQCTLYSERQRQHLMSMIQQIEYSIDSLFAEYRGFKEELSEYERGEGLGDGIKLNPEQELEDMETMAKSIRYNHDIREYQSLDVSIDPDEELDDFGLKITQLTLPHRFGMYRQQMRNVPVKTPVELEDPIQEGIESRSAEDGENPVPPIGGKTRKIF